MISIDQEVPKIHSYIHFLHWQRFSTWAPPALLVWLTPHYSLKLISSINFSENIIFPLIVPVQFLLFCTAHTTFFNGFICPTAWVFLESRGFVSLTSMFPISNGCHLEGSLVIEWMNGQMNERLVWLDDYSFIAMLCNISYEV